MWGANKNANTKPMYIYSIIFLFIYMLTFFYVREKTLLVDQDHGKIIWNICQHPCINARPCCVFVFCPFFCGEFACKRPCSLMILSWAVSKTAIRMIRLVFEKSSNQWIGGFFVVMEPHHAAPH